MYVIDTVNQQIKKFSKKELASFLNQIITHQFFFASNEQKANEKEIMNTYLQKRQDFYKAISQYRSLYYKGN